MRKTYVLNTIRIRDFRAYSSLPGRHFYLLGNYLNPQSRQNSDPKHLNIAQKAIVLHTLGVQVPSPEMISYYSSAGPLWIGHLAERGREVDGIWW